MHTITHKINHTSRTDTFWLYHLTDLHVGARACDEKRLRRDIQNIVEQDNAYWIGGGDYIDAICNKGDKRYNAETIADWVDGNDIMMQQVDYVSEMLRPIAAKCLGLVKGNHEEEAVNHYDRDVYWSIVRNMAGFIGKEPHELALGVEGFVVLNFRRRSGDSQGHSLYRFTIYTHHGAGGGRLPGGHALALGRVLGDYECDLALLGHRHVKQMVSKMIVTSKGTREAVGLFVPSYLQSYLPPRKVNKKITNSYAQLKMLPPLPIGTMPIHIIPNEGRFEVVVSS